ncbi:MAG: hypothetical protein HC914_12095 [Chloroflexaceae bacterium]|nr:hypothetical protein [Chloroflexaceae bacterium]
MPQPPHVSWQRLLPVFFLLTSLIGCAAVPPMAPPAVPTAALVALPTEPPTPTLVTLDETVRLQHSGVSLAYPSGWQTRELSNTLTLAPRLESLESSAPGDDLVILVDTVPLTTLAEWYGAETANNVEALFRISSEGPQQAGYTLGATVPITVGGASGLAADLEAAGGSGRLIVLRQPPHMVRLLGQAAPAAWQQQLPLFEDILASVSFFAPAPTATPTPENQALQPVLISDGPAGFVLRLGGNLGEPEGRFVATRGLAAAEDGTLYVAESSRGIWVFAPDGTLRRTFGEEDLLDAYDVAIGTDGDIFVADFGRNAITRFTPDGTLVKRWGGAGEGPDQFGLQSPQRIAIGADGSIYALDSRVAGSGSTSSIVRFQPDGTLIERIALPDGSAPNDLAVDPVGNIYLAEPFGGAVLKISSEGQPIDRLGDDFDGGITAGAVDVDRTGNVLAATWGKGIIKFTFDGTVLGTVGSPAETGNIPKPGEFSLPGGVAAGPGNIVWVSDNDGEYSAVTALRLVGDRQLQATAAAQATASVTPIPLSTIIRQWASGATASSNYEGYDPYKATGRPDTEGCRDSQNAWASADPNGLETLELEYSTPVFATGVVVYQNHQPGFISKIEVMNEDGKATTVYEREPRLLDICPYVLEVAFEPTLTRIVAVRLTVDQRDGANWSEVDAVELIGAE